MREYLKTVMARARRRCKWGNAVNVKNIIQ